VHMKIPSSLKAEHDELHSELARAIKAGGKTGKAAEAVARVLEPHFKKEEEYALPPLSLLLALAQGEVSHNMLQAEDMVDRLKADLDNMLHEHRMIIEALREMKDAAVADGKAEFISFPEKLTQHALIEEEVLYPASLLVGEYLRLRREA
jgi:hypothetical protein